MTLSPIRPASAGYKVSWVKLKKCILVQALRFSTGRTSHRGSRGIALLFFDYSTRRGEGWVSRPGRSSPPGKTRYPLYRRLSGPQGWSGQVQKISPPPGFDPRTIQPVASCFTDYTTHWIKVVLDKFVWWGNCEFKINNARQTEQNERWLNFWWTKRYVILSVEAGLVSEMRVWSVC